MSTWAASEVVVTALGAVSPVGNSAVSTCAALRARIARFHAHPFFLPQAPTPALEEPEPARVAPSLPLPGPGTRLERLLELALPALKELIATSGLSRGDLEDTRWLFSLPGTGGGRPESAAGPEFVSAYFERLAVVPARAPVVHQEGHTGILTALAQAMDLLRQGQCRFCILVGVDSSLDPATLLWLDKAWRLKSARNVDGFIPGECASVMLLELRGQARARGRPVLARLERVGASQEGETLEGPRLSTGQGLTRAIRSAWGETPPREPFWTLCDLNGESYRAHEWGLCLARLGELLSPQRALWHPADCIGDVGAASGGLYVAMVCRAFARGYAPAARALLWAAADGGTRAACILSAPD